jgi:hypothetical protein
MNHQAADRKNQRGFSKRSYSRGSLGLLNKTGLCRLSGKLFDFQRGFYFNLDARNQKSAEVPCSAGLRRCMIAMQSKKRD